MNQGSFNFGGGDDGNDNGRPRTLAEAQELGDEGLARVERRAPDWWKDQASDIIHQICLTRLEFHCDEVWKHGLEHTEWDRALGACFRQAAKFRWCVKTDRLLPSINSRGGPKPVWRSLIYKPEVPKC